MSLPLLTKLTTHLHRWYVLVYFPYFSAVTYLYRISLIAHTGNPGTSPPPRNTRDVGSSQQYDTFLWCLLTLLGILITFLFFSSRPWLPFLCFLNPHPQPLRPFCGPYGISAAVSQPPHCSYSLSVALSWPLQSSHGSYSLSAALAAFLLLLFLLIGAHREYEKSLQSNNEPQGEYPRAQGRLRQQQEF